MEQDIITTAIIAASTGYTLYNLYGMIFLRKKKITSHCAGCAGCEIKIKRQVS